MSRLRLTALAACLAVSALASAPTIQAAEKPKKATAQVKSDLYVTAVEAHDLLAKDDKALLIDVRDPIEIMFTGHAKGTDVFIPYKFANLDQWNEKKSVFMMETNKTFAASLDSALQKMGASKEDKLIFICRSGSTRSAPAADLMFDLGYKNSYTVVDGFEGGKLKEGPSKGVRAKNGWRNAGLPWTYKLDKAQMTKAVTWTKD